MTSRLRIRTAIVTAVLLAAVAVGCDSSSDTTTPSSTTTTTTIIVEPLDVAKQAVVDVSWAEERDGRIVLTGPGGSGSVVTEDGLILTNAHVGAPDAPGLAVLYGDVGGIEAPDLLVVRFVEQEDRPPVARFLAEPRTVDGWLDLAVLEPVATVETTADGGLVRGEDVVPGSLDLVAIPVGSSDAVRSGDELIVLGFPGIGGQTLSVTGNLISGFLDDEKLGPRGWIKTDAKIAPGNSGGMALVDGRLVGVPTRGPSDSDSGFEQLRPIDFAKDLIADAVGGMEYVEATGVVLGTGAENLTHESWAAAVDQSTGCASEAVAGFPSGTKTIYSIFDWRSFTDGEDVMFAWVKDATSVLSSSFFSWDLGTEGECFWLAFSGREGGPLEDGRYAVLVYAGPFLTRVGAASAEVGVETENRIGIVGVAVDRDTGQPIAEALLFFLEPGTDAQAWVEDPSSDVLVASGKTGEDGSADLGSVFVPGTTYPVVGFIQGYNTIIASYTVAADQTTDLRLNFRFAKSGG